MPDPCPYCGRQMDGTRHWHSTYPTKDHVTPRSRQGRVTVLVCRQCNADKADLPIQGWLGLLRRRGDPRARFVAAFIEKHPWKVAQVWLPPPLPPKPPPPLPPGDISFHEDRPKKRWTCNACNRGFGTEDAALMHYRDSHRKEANDNHISEDHPRQHLA